MSQLRESHACRGAFTFSLDFELAWGTRGRANAPLVPPYLDGAREAIRRLLRLFEKYEVSATWATVGAMLLESTDGRQRHGWLRGHEFAEVPAGNSASHPHWYARDILDDILACEIPQDVGCHTLTHLLVDPGPAGRQPLKQDLQKFLELFEGLNLPRPTSFIFPKAKMGHYDVLAECGFRAFRGPEAKWFESLPSVRTRALARMIDAKLVRPPLVRRPRQLACGIWEIPSSQFYSPFMNVGRYVSLEARVQKAVTGLQLAAARGDVFHLWTHPFNLGLRTDELLDGIEQILAAAADLRAANRLHILNMREVVTHHDTARKATSAVEKTRPGARGEHPQQIGCKP